MLRFSIQYKCSVCNNHKDWYIMPLDEKVASGDIVSSNTNFKIQCKKCGQTYLFSLSMKRIEKKAN